MEFTEFEIEMAMQAHNCTREEAISTYAAQVRAFREAQRPALLLEGVRLERNRRLAETDWWVLPDRTPTQEQLDYRQALRDITNNFDPQVEVVWPTKP